MKIIHEDLSAQTIETILIDDTKNFGLLKIVLRDGTEIRLSEEIVDANHYLNLNLSPSTKPAIMLKVLPRAGNSIWIGASEL